MTTDLTRGSPLKRIFFFAMPFLIGNLFQQFYNVIDMIIVGRTVGTLAYAAVGSTGSLVWFASGAIQSMTVGFSVVTAHHFGSGDEEKVKRSFAGAIKLSALISIALSVIYVLCARSMLTVMRTPDTLFEDAYNYIVWIFAGLIVTALFNLLSNMIRALGDSKTPLYFLVVSCVVNIILDIILIRGCNMGTAGAGLATVIAQLVSGICCIIYLIKKHPMLHVKKAHFKTDFAMDKHLLKIGIPMAFLDMVLSIGSIIVQFVTNGFGDSYVAAQVTGGKIDNFIVQPLIAFGSAVAVFTAQNHGAGNYKRVLEGSKKTLLICIAWCILAAAIILPFGKAFITLIAGNDVTESVINDAYRYVVINTAFTFIVAALIVYKSVLQAVNRTTWSMISGFTEIIGRGGVALLVVFLTERALVSESLGFSIVCLANPMAWLFGLLTILADYLLMKSKFKKLAKEQTLK